MKSNQSRAVMDRREQRCNIAAANQDLWPPRNHIEIKLRQQIIGAVAAAHTDHRGNIITPPVVKQLMCAALRRARKVNVTIKNVLRVDWLVSHLAQAIAAAQKRFVVETAGRRNQADLVALPQRRRLDDLRIKAFCARQGILPGRSAARDRAKKLCRLATAPPGSLRAHAPS